MSRLPIRLRLTLTYVALLAVVMALVLGASWLLLERHLARTVPARYLDPILEQLASQYVLALLGAALLALGIGWLAAGRALAPLGRIAATARRVSEDHLDARVRMDDAPDDELREVATAFDAMLDRVAASLAAQQRFTANASHELRTPLTIIRSGSEVVLEDPKATVEDLRAAARDAVETTERMEELLDGLLLLAALDGSRRGGAALGARRPGAPSCGRRRGRCARRPTTPGIELHAALAPAATRGDPALLERLAANLVENAIRHGARGPVWIEVRGDASRVRLRVANGGEPIAAEQLARLTQPFERLRRSRARGSGLGLSIVRAVAEAHGGELRAGGARGRRAGGRGRAAGGAVGGARGRCRRAAGGILGGAAGGYGEVTGGAVASAP